MAFGQISDLSSEESFLASELQGTMRGSFFIVLFPQRSKLQVFSASIFGLTMKPRTKRILKRSLYVMLSLLLLLGIGTYGAVEYAKRQLFRDTPNTLRFEGELAAVPFQWQADPTESFNEPHGAILIPVTVSGLSNTFYMQFDTGSPDTFLRSEAVEQIKNHGVDLEILQDEDGARIKKIKFDVAGNNVTLESGMLFGRSANIDWENPEAINIIGSFGADFLDQKVSEIDFPSQEIRLHRERPSSLSDTGEFAPFKFKGRRIMFPATIDGSDVEVFYDSGCSAFGLLTSKYYYDLLTDPNVKEIAYGASRHGDSVSVHHKSSDLRIKLGATEIELKRISYVELYSFLQTTVGRLIGGGFFGNKSMVKGTLIIDTIENEFLFINVSE